MRPPPLVPGRQTKIPPCTLANTNATTCCSTLRPTCFVDVMAVDASLLAAATCRTAMLPPAGAHASRMKLHAHFAFLPVLGG
mmetsp:Transcript_66291/g.181800  ORF Transcript_66291/g.181800 Transcript_66291/m.181800 type:complete len:82 (-) Transcript_66291:592-837(-)|eukprot:560320-Prymnesium_polylepis.1